ncbi:MAG: ATP-binding protein [Thermoplasmata archaeon]
MAQPSVAKPSPALSFGQRSTAAELKARGERIERPADHVRREILRQLEVLRGHGASDDAAIQALFPHTILPTDVYRDLVTALVAGAHVLFFGPSGAGKTSLAKDLWELFPKGAWVVNGCPVLDHPLSVCDPDMAAQFPPCPICRRRFAPEGEVARFDPSRVDPSRVPAEYIQLREGYGLARVQGSSEVFPDHLTGNINLRKLEEVGDPMSPLVLEPGKLLQANRGLLLVDEIGKLPLGTQNVLLQALQEGTVSPSKSRETFPAHFLAVCTSNLSDLDNINDPLSDRLTSLHIGFNTQHAANRRIVELARTTTDSTRVPEILWDAGVRVIESWRLRMSSDNPDIGEVGSNRTLIDVHGRAQAIATIAGRSIATVEDLKAGLRHAMRGRIRARSGDSYEQNEHRVDEFLGQHLEPCLKKSAGVYWCRFFRDVLHESKPNAEGLVSEGRRLKDDAAMRSQLASDGNLFPKFRPFVTYVSEREGGGSGASSLDTAIGVFDLLERFSLFTCGPEELSDDRLGD